MADTLRISPDAGRGGIFQRFVPEALAFREA